MIQQRTFNKLINGRIDCAQNDRKCVRDAYSVILLLRTPRNRYTSSVVFNYALYITPLPSSFALEVFCISFPCETILGCCAHHFHLCRVFEKKSLNKEQLLNSFELPSSQWVTLMILESLHLHVGNYYQKLFLNSDWSNGFCFLLYVTFFSPISFTYVTPTSVFQRC